MRTNGTRLNVQCLEAREVPACLVTNPTPDTLVVTGNSANDLVILRDNGAGGIAGFATGAGVFNFSGIRTIKVNTGGGDDQVYYNLVRNLLPGQQRLVDVRTEAGNDSFSASLYNPANGIGSDLRASSGLTIVGLGGDGNDSMRIDAGRDVDVAHGASLKMMLFGDAGNDFLSAQYRGENDGAVSIRELDGGRGNDLIRGTYFADPGSTGIAVAAAHGGAGDDFMSLSLFGPIVVPSLLDGGSHVNGDVGFATPNVTVINVNP
jgi:hypothetical protein